MGKTNIMALLIVGCLAAQSFLAFEYMNADGPIITQDLALSAAEVRQDLLAENDSVEDLSMEEILTTFQENFDEQLFEPFAYS